MARTLLLVLVWRRTAENAPSHQRIVVSTVLGGLPAINAFFCGVPQAATAGVA